MRASIDLGSNMAQLLIVDSNKKEKIFQNFTSLGEGTFKTKLLSLAARDRTLKVLIEFKKILNEYKIDPSDVIFCATEACRVATNREDFFKELRGLGFNPNLLNTQQEAYLGCLGAMSQLVNPTLDYISMDIGGASTEVAMLDVCGQLKNYLSLKIGTLAVTEWLKNSTVAENLTNIKSEYMDNLQVYQHKSLVCTRGTMTSLFNLVLNNTEVEEKSFHGSQIQTLELITKLREIQKTTHQDLLQKYPYLKLRLPTLDAGIEICIIFCELLKPKQVILSERGLTHGALLVDAKNFFLN